jgi:hypothetical protein
VEGPSARMKAIGDAIAIRREIVEHPLATIKGLDGAKGKIMREGTTITDPKSIAGFIASYAPDAMRIGLESGATSTWLWFSTMRC